MKFVLSSQNVFDYLVEQELCTPAELEARQVEMKTAKNFNLLLGLPDGRKLLVKQERPNKKKTTGELASEWRLHKFLQRFPELSHLRPFLCEILHFNEHESVMVLNYLDDYCDLTEFYAQNKTFPTTIATLMGTLLATIHRATSEHQAYRNFFWQNQEDIPVFWKPGRIGPEVFGYYTGDILKFFSLYQRYDSLEKAIAELTDSFNLCCLVHNDLKLNNILLHLGWEATPSSQSPMRLIDWERCSWGDPAFDLGTSIASYLQLWLSSLVISTTISLEESLRLAMIPLEQLQPSIAALLEAYLQQFPEILAIRSDFLHRVVQFAGLALIHQIQAAIQHQKSFGNADICTLQVAKSLLCNPAQSFSTVFGLPESELTAKCNLMGYTTPLSS
jgi:thiamine kinase-like enzyme